MCKYFFLGSVLPTLSIGRKPDLVFEDLLELLQVNMKRSDLEKVTLIRRHIDLKNVQQLLKKQPLDPRGNFTEKQLDEALLNRVGLPEYLFSHLDAYESIEDQLRHFSKVFIQFFQDMDQKKRGFLKFYFNFEREWRLILAGYRAKKLGLDPIKELQHEDPTDPFVAQILAQKEAPFFEFPFGYEELNEKINEVDGDPMLQYESMATFRFNTLADRAQDNPFSVDYVLGYFVQQMIVENWNALDDNQGKESLQQIIKGSL